jgi:hypothetical protein
MIEKRNNEIYESDKWLTMLMALLNFSVIAVFGVIFWSVYMVIENSAIFVRLIDEGVWH